jgi:ketosteroid isomerase-like protein
LKDSAHGNAKAENARLIKQQLESLVGVVPGLLRAEVGIDFGGTEQSFDIALYAEFESAEALQGYQNHPAHQAVVSFIREARHERVVVDYERDGESAVNDVVRAVTDTVTALNDCWTGGHPADLVRYFHENIVAITPANRLPLVGRDACVEAWTQYTQVAKIAAWRTDDVQVRVHGDTAIVTYLYELECEVEGRRAKPAGRDMLVMVRENGRWWVVADQFSPYPGGTEL